MTEPYRDSMHVDTLHSWAVDAQAELEQLRAIAKELAAALIESDAWVLALHNKSLAPLLGDNSPALDTLKRNAIALAKYEAMVK